MGAPVELKTVIMAKLFILLAFFFVAVAAVEDAPVESVQKSTTNLVQGNQPAKPFFYPFMWYYPWFWGFWPWMFMVPPGKKAASGAKATTNLIQADNAPTQAVKPFYYPWMFMYYPWMYTFWPWMW